MKIQFLLFSFFLFFGFTWASENNPFLKKEKDKNNPVLNKNGRNKKSAFTDVLDEKYVCYYDSLIITSWDTTTSDWRAEAEKRIFQYDANKNVISEERYLTNGFGWNLVSRSLNTYNEKNLVLTEKQERWQGNHWVNFSLVNYYYDGNYNLIKQESLDWADSVYVKNNENISTYDSRNNLLSSTNSFYYNGSIVFGVKTINSYDANNNMIESYFQQMNTMLAPIWINALKFTFTYNSENQVIEGYSYKWSGFSWEKEFYYTDVTYDNSNNRTGFTEKEWITNTWINKSRETSNYDSDHNLTYNLIEVWDTMTNVFVNDEMNKYDFNQNGVEYYSESKKWINGDWEFLTIGNSTICSNDICLENKIEETFDIETGDYTKGKRAYFGCNSAISLNDLKEMDSIQVFPNPCSNNMVINGITNEVSKIQLQNLMGEVVYCTSSIKADEGKINLLTEQKPGIYFLIIEMNQARITRKIIME